MKNVGHAVCSPEMNIYGPDPFAFHSLWSPYLFIWPDRHKQPSTLHAIHLKLYARPEPMIPRRPPDPPPHGSWTKIRTPS